MTKQDSPSLPGEEAPFPTRLSPMQPTLSDKPFSDPDWLFEPKPDGFRVITLHRDGKVSLLSRNGNDSTSKYPNIASELFALMSKDAVLDGEVVALNESGEPDCGLLQRISGMQRGTIDDAREPAALMYYMFDLLYLDGRLLLRNPLTERKSLLSESFEEGDSVKSVQVVGEHGEMFFDASGRTGLEGMVAKRKNSIYRPGTRTRSWLKIKNVQIGHFLVVGYSKGEGSRASTLGPLVLGYHEAGKLRYAGRVGSGFDDTTLKALRSGLELLKVDVCPFPRVPKIEGRGTTCIEPRFTAEIRFAEWTRDGILRAPVFLSLREVSNP